LEIGVEMERGVKYSCMYEAWNGLVLIEECQFPLYANSTKYFPQVPHWSTYILNIISFKV
jgi:hypothetical protein